MAPKSTQSGEPSFNIQCCSILGIAYTRDVLRWGKNIGSSKTRTKKRVGATVYNRASSLETLVGYLYLTDKKRLEEVMLKLGFLCN